MTALFPGNLLKNGVSEKKIRCVWSRVGFEQGTSGVQNEPRTPASACGAHFSERCRPERCFCRTTIVALLRHAHSTDLWLKYGPTSTSEKVAV